jgi:RNA polymerase sigma-32 factor
MKNTRSTKRPNYPLASKSNIPATASGPELQIYLDEIRRFRVLDREEMNELAVRFQEHNDIDAGRRLVLANLRLVVKIATDFQFYWHSNVLDLIQEGNMGLMRAVKMFNPYRGVKFSFYAAYWIKAYILKYIMNNWRLVKITTTETMRKLFFNLNLEKRKLASLGIEVDNKVLADRLQVSERDVAEMTYRLNGSELSLDMPVSDDSSSRLEDLMASQDPATEDIVGEQQLQAKVRSILSQEKEKLSPREVAILDERLMTDRPKTLQQLAEQFHISRERIRQTEVALLNKMRSVFRQHMPDYAASAAAGW